MSKKCPSCRTSVADNVKFCPDCGTPISKNAVKQAAAKKKSGLRDTLIIVGVLAVVAVAFFIMQKPKEIPRPPQQQQSNTNHPEVEGMDNNMMGALANLPTDFGSLVSIGNQTMDQGNYAMAAECYRRALELKHDDYNDRTDYGACLHGMGLPDRAIQEFKHVISEHKEHGIAHFNLGIVYYSVQQPDSAKTYFNKYLKLEPAGKAAEAARTYLKEIG